MTNFSLFPNDLNALKSILGFMGKWRPRACAFLFSTSTQSAGFSKTAPSIGEEVEYPLIS